ncbi:choline/ethanolaminephosphotransferase 2 isoform X3 [Helianthus annuus]|uniref:choline/ethanolaminephosphotransferase 2 isoform X3 n=1 Tax=Helianthus annuus TaxID=4232 RepID=UPI001652DEAD|nr:choline/ethanolaminephosphotransferase 2 isoform X3 [Helianthus annuus]
MRDNGILQFWITRNMFSSCGIGIAFFHMILDFPLAIANTLTARLNDGIPYIDEKWVLLGFCIYAATLYLHFATSVIIHEITTSLGIYCFRDKNRKEKGLRHVHVRYEGYYQLTNWNWIY